MEGVFTLGARRPGRPGAGPVALMRLVEVDDVGEILDYTGQDDLMVEVKFNGWLVQWARGRLWTRRGKDLTGKFPHIVETLGNYPGEHIIGELVYWDQDGIMDEPAVTHVAGTKDPDEAVEKLDAMPGRFQMVAFDLLYGVGHDLAGLATWERREILKDILEPTEAVELSEGFGFGRWKKLYRQAVRMGGDGVVFKNLEAPYEWRPLGQPEARPVGFWWKLKPVKVDDFVVYGTTRGPKGSLLVLIGQYWQGELVPIGKFDNFSADVEAEILALIKKGPFVMEVAYQARFPKPPGRLQHPRLERIRYDKDPEQAELPARHAPG